MSHYHVRIIAAAGAALVAFAFPAAAGAHPAAEPPARTSHTVDAVRATIDELSDAYRCAPIAQKRGIHDEILLLVNIGHAAL